MKLLPNIPFKIVVLIVIALITTASWLIVREKIRYNKLQEQKRIELLEKDMQINDIVQSHARASIMKIDRQIQMQDSLNNVISKLQDSKSRNLKIARELARKTEENEKLRNSINDVIGSSIDIKSDVFTRAISESIIE